MAIVMPGVDYRQLPGKSRVPLQPRWVTVHTMVGTLDGTESWFTPRGRAYSHHGLGGDGEVRQWQDLRYRAASDLEGNPYSISWECADHGPEFAPWSGSDVPPFTPAQVDALIVGLSWDCHRFGLPRAAIRSSCPHERGIGWHRLGIDPYRQDGCLRWSSSTGKVCPGDRRIAQLRDEIIPRVSAPNQGGFLMALDDHAQQVIHDSVLRQEKALAKFLGSRDEYLGRGETAYELAVTAGQILDAARTHGYLAKRKGAQGGASIWVPADHAKDGVVVLSQAMRSWIHALTAISGLPTTPVEVDGPVYDELIES